MRVLLVDDDAFALRLLARQLAQAGIDDVQTSAGANEALQMMGVAGAGFDVLFIDLNMPAMDGVEFLRHLAAQRFRGALVLVSGEDPRVLNSVASLAKERRLRVIGSLRKPVPTAELQKVLAALPSDTPTTVTPAVRRSYGADELRAAIAEGRLVNHYQPKVELASGKVIGAEALVRWRHPTDGLVYPDRFVSLAETNGLSRALAHAVLARALDDARDWAGAGLKLLLAVNVSMNDLVALDFPDQVARAVELAGLAPSRLTLEITESQAMRDPRVLLDIATRLRLKRIGLSIDDFGTGYSSLAQLRDVPFDELKLDRSFVRGAGGTAALRTMLEANLGMARQLGLRTVAEGLESRDDWDCLRGLGCDLGQGYLIARPMAAAQVPDWIRQWQARLPDASGSA